MDLDLRGSTAVVTGASRGLGLACAGSLSNEGARVFMAARHEDALASAAEKVGAVGHLSTDMCVAEDVERLAETAAHVLSTVDTVVVNCGGPPVGRFSDMSDADWIRGSDLTLMSAVRTARAFMPMLRASGRGRLIFVTASGYREPQPGLIVSDAMRAAVAVLAKVLSRELAPDGVTVNAIAPGPFDTGRLDDFPQSTVDELRQTIPVGRFGRAEELGDWCAFLASPRSSYLTGQSVVIDGGTQRGI